MTDRVKYKSLNITIVQQPKVIPLLDVVYLPGKRDPSWEQCSRAPYIFLTLLFYNTDTFTEKHLDGTQNIFLNLFFFKGLLTIFLIKLECLLIFSVKGHTRQPTENKVNKVSCIISLSWEECNFLNEKKSRLTVCETMQNKM